jgi:hypothetical protein
MKQLKLIMLFCIGASFIASESIGQANPYINVLPSNSGIVSVGATIDIEVTIGNLGPVSTIAQAKLRPIIQVPASVTFLSNAQQTGLPAGWSILSNTGSQLRLCNTTDAIAKNTNRTIILKVQGVTVTAAQSFVGNINFGNGTTCSAGTTVAGDLINDNTASSTIQVVAPASSNLNLTAFIQGYDNGAGGMVAARYDNLVAAGSATPGNATDVDSVTVELHDAVTPATVSYTTTGMLQTNGTLAVTFPGATIGNSYYIALKHQNSVQLWSAAAVAITSTTAYNFSTALTQAYTDGSTDPMVLLPTGIYGMYSGDINQDEYIDGSDYSIYEVDVDNSTNLGLFSLASDLNGDTYVDGSDFPLFDINSSNSLYSQHP